jgi:hypothetical protein
MEIEVQEFYMLFQITLINLTHVFLGDAHFSSRFVPQEVDNVNRAIGLNDVINVQPKCLFRHLRVAGDRHIFKDTFLLPKNGHRTTDLNVAEHKLIVNQKDLFSFTLVSNIAQIIDTTCVVARAGPMVDSASHERYHSIQKS